MRLPLEGVTVVDLTAVVSGAVATMLMVQFGADVIKVEPPGGEAYRNYGLASSGSGAGANINLLRWTRGKRSVVIDLKSPGGKEALWRLIDAGDVLIENLRPGVLSRLGFDFEAMRKRNPNLIYSTVSGFGHRDVLDSPRSEDPAYAIVVEAMAGLLSLRTDSKGTPIWLGFALADIFSGVLAFAGTLLALRQRDTEPQANRRVDVAMFDASAFMNDLPLLTYSLIGQVNEKYRTSQPWGVYTAKDGFFVIAVMTLPQWTSLCSVIGRPDLANDQRMTTGASRAQHHDEIIQPAIAAWARERTREEIDRELHAAGVPSGPINDAREVFESEELSSREMVVEAIDDNGKPFRVVGNPIKVPGASQTDALRVPRLGEHTRTVFCDELGMDPDEYKLRIAEGAIAEDSVES